MGEPGEHRAAPERIIYGPKDAAARLGIGVTGLRRRAVTYERVRGALPRDERGRVWPEDSVGELEEARVAVREGRATSVEAALRGAASDTRFTPARAGEEAAESKEPYPQDPVIEELRALRAAVEEQNRRVGELVEENRQLRAALPPPDPGPESGVPPALVRVWRLVSRLVGTGRR
jgi:hypothetical protein